MSNKLKCPICKTENAMVEVDVCQFCGSLEGMDLSIEIHNNVKKTMFGYDWGNGFGAPYKTNDGSVAYTTSKDLATMAFDNVRINNKTLVIDLGCGDAIILRTAAKLYRCYGLGVDIDDHAVQDSQNLIKEENLESLITIEKINFMNIDLLNYVKTKVQQLHCVEISTVIITAYLLPQLLEKLKPTFINMLTSIENLALCIICFKWNFGDISKSKKTISVDEKDGYTIYSLQNQILKN